MHAAQHRSLRNPRRDWKLHVIAICSLGFLLISCNSRLYVPGSGVDDVSNRLGFEISGTNTVASYVCVPYTVTVKDAQGTIQAVDRTTQIHLTGFGNGELFATRNDCIADLTASSVFVAAGSSSVTFYYKTAVSETLTLTASATGFSAGSLPLSTVIVNVLGQTDSNSLVHLRRGMNSTEKMWSDGTRLYLVESQNHRVIGWNSIPTTMGRVPDFVLGQADFTTNVANPNGVTASSLRFPNGVYGFGGRLYVADSGNHRVLVWNTLPTSNGVPANFALGQPDLLSGTSNNGGISASSMRSPMGAYSDGTRLFVPDLTNNRVLVWNTLPTISGQAASFALGQPNTFTGTVNTGGISASTMNEPYGVYTDGTRVIVADASNNRVLGWTSMPTTNGQAANFVLGQPGFGVSTPNNGGISASRMSYPIEPTSNGTNLVLADHGNCRAMVWNTLPTSSVAADLVLGHPGPTIGGCNVGGISASSQKGAHGAVQVGTRLFLSDDQNHRVLVWNTFPTVSGQAANYALGQPDLVSGTPNNPGVNGSFLNLPRSGFSDGTRFYLADTANNRVLVWNTLPTSNTQAADFVLGQPNLTSNTANNGGVSGATMSGPTSVYSDGVRLYVADTGNHRVLVWSSLPSSSGATASFALGQSLLTGNSANAGGLSASSLNSPNAVTGNGTKIFVADTGNNRVLGWNTTPSSGAQAAIFALGQPSLTVATVNNGGISASSLSAPNGAYITGTQLYVSDTSNNRVLVWDTLPSSNAAAASFVLGQPSVSVNTANNGGISAARMSGPTAAYVKGSELFVSDTANHRVLVWSSLPSSTGQTATSVLGQPNATGNTANNGGLSVSRLSSPTGVFGDDTRLFVVDRDNYRVLMLPVP